MELAPLIMPFGNIEIGKNHTWCKPLNAQHTVLISLIHHGHFRTTQVHKTTARKFKKLALLRNKLPKKFNLIKRRFGFKLRILKNL